MTDQATLGVPPSLYVQPLLAGLTDKDAPFEHHVDLPAQLSRFLSQRIPPLSAGCALLTPLDYCRHGGDYRIVPDVCLASSLPSGTIRLYVQSDTRNIRSVAMDIRITSEILLAKVLLVEKFKILEATQDLVVHPMMPDLPSMLSKADAALIVHLGGNPPPPTDVYCLDLVEEWFDLTGLPYVHNFWVYHDGDLSAESIKLLQRAATKGRSEVRDIAEQQATHHGGDASAYASYLEKFSTVLDLQARDSLQEFFHYLFYFGAIGDIPDLVFGGDSG